jgi:hypothetical protein
MQYTLETAAKGGTEETRVYKYVSCNKELAVLQSASFHQHFQIEIMAELLRVPISWTKKKKKVTEDAQKQHRKRAIRPGETIST